MTLMKRTEFLPSIPSFMDNLFSRDWMDWASSNFSTTNTTLPAVNIKETDNDYMIEVAVPGMDKKDIKVNLENNQLSISSEKKEEMQDKKENYSRKEFSYQSFHRSFSFPQGLINGEKIAAKYSDGVLYITLPKREEIKPKPAKEIKVL